MNFAVTLLSTLPRDTHQLIFSPGELMCRVRGGMRLQAWWVGESVLRLTPRN
jgi:hypothetical protein